MANREPIPVAEIVAALEREAANTDTDPRWMAAQCLRHVAGWESRTLMCFVDTRPSTPETAVAPNQKCPRCGFVTQNVFDCPTCKNPDAPFGGAA